MSEKEIIYNNIKHLFNTRNYKTNYTFQTNLNNIDYTIIKTDDAIILYIINPESYIIKKSNIFLKKINELLLYNKKIIIITKVKLSSNLQKKITLIKKNFIIELILYNALIFNFASNNVIKYLKITKLSEIEQKKIFNFLDIKIENSLYLCQDDMISIWWDLSPGDYVLIENISPLSNFKNSYYRLVTESTLSGFRFIFTSYNIDLNINNESDSENSDNNISNDDNISEYTNNDNLNENNDENENENEVDDNNNADLNNDN